MLSLNMLLPPPSPFLLLPPSLLLTPPPGAQRLLMSTPHKTKRVTHMVPSSSDSGSLGIIITNSQTSEDKVLTMVGRGGLINTGSTGFVNLRDFALTTSRDGRWGCARRGEEQSDEVTK